MNLYDLGGKILWATILSNESKHNILALVVKANKQFHLKMVPQGHNILKVILPYFCGRQIFEEDFFLKL
jgi:hypothetical protein